MEEQKKEPQVLKLEIGNISAKVKLDIGLDDFARSLKEIALISNSSKYADFVADQKIAKAKADEEATKAREEAKAKEETERKIILEQLRASDDLDIKKYIDNPLLLGDCLELCHINWVKLVRDKKIDPYFDKLKTLNPMMRQMTLASDPSFLRMLNMPTNN